MFSLILDFSLAAQETGQKTISKHDLQRYLNFLSSDSLQGRAIGAAFPGLDIAANYIKENAKKAGLSPGVPGYFQKVPVISSHPDRENTYLQITKVNGEVIYKTDSVIGLPSGAGINISNAEIVFAGFGWHDEKTGYDDFHEIDFTGKVVMFASGTPESFQKNELQHWNNQLEIKKIKKAIELGASAVILVNNPLNESNSNYNRLNRWINRNDFSLENKVTNNTATKFAFISTSQGDAILGETGKLKVLLTGIVSKNQPASFLIDEIRISINVNRKTETVEAKNIVGILEGSDPVLKNEYVVFMAHYDHIGVDSSGNVFNGADDNGSGTVVLLEVAEAFATLAEKPKRSIVFLWVTAEEVGMLGSKYYIEHPVFPVEKTVACINIDMAGRVFEQRDTVWNKSEKKVKDFDGLYTLTNDFWPGLKEINSNACKTLGLIPDYSLPSGFLHSSDHFSFHSHGIPILNYATGYHADYHKISDEISKINFDKMKRVADLCFLVGSDIANLEKIEFEKSKKAN